MNTRSCERVNGLVPCAARLPVDDGELQATSGTRVTYRLGGAQVALCRTRSRAGRAAGDLSYRWASSARSRQVVARELYAVPAVSWPPRRSDGAVRAGSAETAHEAIKRTGRAALAIRERGLADNYLLDRLAADDQAAVEPG